MKTLYKGISDMTKKTKTLICVDTEILKVTKQICSAMGIQFSSFTENLYRAFLESEKLPYETMEQVVRKFQKEFRNKVKTKKKQE